MLKYLNLGICAIAGVAATFAAGVPRVDNVSISQDDTTKLVTISYSLLDAPGVVTFDVQTNVSEGVWASVGGNALSDAYGDVNCYVELKEGAHRIFWMPPRLCPEISVESGTVRAVLTAWPEESPPDYMVIDLNTGRVEGDTSSLLSKHAFYPDESHFPGGISNRVYKTEKLVMRKIPVSKDIKWVMGQDKLKNAIPHYVTLTNSFYMGIYEMTFRQWENLCGGVPGTIVKYFYTNFTDNAELPMSGVDFFEIRGSIDGSGWAAGVDPQTRRKVSANYSAYPTPLHRLRVRTGILFDLPTEAQWEYACRAGEPLAFNNAKASTAEACDEVAWYNENSSAVTKYGDSVLSVHPVGTKGAPNRWGLYDMHGNASELCLDIWQADIGTEALEPVGAAKPSEDKVYRLVRGGNAGSDYGECQSGYRTYKNVSAHGTYNGLRVVCPYPLNLNW
ncbi:MAG: formylglycine-generating enzyme family protein [Kiritimatiellae bacterium]|nr:formylglycine-generating enzyme family protein [Kiritimatiellia bacterium]